MAATSAVIAAVGLAASVGTTAYTIDQSNQQADAAAIAATKQQVQEKGLEQQAQRDTAQAQRDEEQLTLAAQKRQTALATMPSRNSTLLTSPLGVPATKAPTYKTLLGQ